MKKFMQLLKEQYMRLLWLLLAGLYGYETVNIWLTLSKYNQFHPLILVAATGTVAFMVLGIFRHNEYVAKIEEYISYLGLLVIPVYLIASAILMVLVAIGWDGCVFSSESYWICSGRLEIIWRAFPTTSPFHEQTYLWGKGFGGGHELYYALATALFVTGLTWLAEIFEKNKMSFINAVLTTSILVAASEAGFYFIFTITQSRESLPGIFISVIVLLTILMLDWWLSCQFKRS